MVWYGGLPEDGKTCEGTPLSVLQAYNQIISLLFSYCIISLVVPYYFPMFPLLFPIVSIIYLLFPS